MTTSDQNKDEMPGPKQPPRLHGEGCICGDSPRFGCPAAKNHKPTIEHSSKDETCMHVFLYTTNTGLRERAPCPWCLETKVAALERENAELHQVCKDWKQLHENNEGCIAGLRAELQRSHEPLWRPIAQAPRDGTWVLVAHKCYGLPVVARWHDGDWLSSSNERGLLVDKWSMLPDVQDTRVSSETKPAEPKTGLSSEEHQMIARLCDTSHEAVAAYERRFQIRGSLFGPIDNEMIALRDASARMIVSAINGGRKHPETTERLCACIPMIARSWNYCQNCGGRIPKNTKEPHVIAGESSPVFQRECHRCGALHMSSLPIGVGVSFCSRACAD